MDWKHYYKALGAEALITGRSAAVATALCVVLLAYSAARLTWMLIPIPSGSAAIPAAATVTPATTSQAHDALAMSREIVAKHLFGQAQTVTATPDPATIPETHLKLVLRGVMASQDPRTATAIIADPSGKEDFYTVGKELPGGATLKEVHAQYIVLSRGGRLETLRLPTDSLNVSSNVAARPGTVTTRGVAPDAGALLQQYRDQFMRDPQSLANLLQGQPYWQNGRMIGFRLQPGREPGLLQKFGIHPGDVVTSVNGVSMTDPSGRMELLRTLRDATQLRVELLRNGSPITISIPVGRRG